MRILRILTIPFVPASMQLRYLQTLIEMSSDRTSTVVFPVPIDVLEQFLRPARRPREEPAEEEIPAEHH